MVVDISGFQYTKGCLPPPREMRALKKRALALKPFIFHLAATYSCQLNQGKHQMHFKDNKANH